MSKVCNFCGNVLNDGDKFCTKCGAVINDNNVSGQNVNTQTNYNAQPNYNVNNNASNGAAVAAMIMGIIGLVFFWAPIIPLILGILALVFGIKGLNASNSLPQNKGKGMGIAGIVCGSIAMIIGFIYTIIWIMAFAFVATEYDTYKNEFNRYYNYDIDLYSTVQTIDQDNVKTILDDYNF
ncbi:MAG: zinc-ribbon domain-containing protein [Clostridia bacterium]|nr:zinc-ribbon domain-containing protein [Clostridia bacterium]